jgi:homoserine kinase
VVVPASVSNLGGGFDTLAVAVQLYLRVRIVDVRPDGQARLTVVRSTPPVRGRNAVERAFEALARRTGLRAPSVSVEVDSDIPMAAGLGSSAAAAVAGLRVFEHVAEPGAHAPGPQGLGPGPKGPGLRDEVLLAVAASLEGHADNAAAALCGGLTSVVDRDGEEPVALRWHWPEELRLVVATPSVGLPTSKARAALPDAVPRKDAVFNLQRVLSLVHALQHGEYDRLREATQDRLHQPARSALVPQLAAVLALEDPEILAAFLSGAGPSVALVARRDFARLERLLTSVYERAGSPATVRTLAVHQRADAREALAACPEPSRGAGAAHRRSV